MDSNRYKIAIVDDDKMMREVLNFRLQSYKKYDVKLFGSGEEVLNESGYRPDLMVLDYCLNGVNEHAMNGGELAEQLNNIPIVMLSSQKKITTAVKLMHLGVCDYIVKDKDASFKVEKSIKEVIKYLKIVRQIKSLKYKIIRNFFKVASTLGLIILIIFLTKGMG